MDNTSKPGSLDRMLAHIASQATPTPKQDPLLQSRSKDELLLGRALPADGKRLRPMARPTLTEQEREAIRVEIEAQRMEDYRSSLLEDQEDEPEDEPEDEHTWDRPQALWHEFTAADRRSLEILWPLHQGGLGVDSVSPVTPEVAERYLPRLQQLYDRVPTIAQFEVRMDAIKVLFVFRCAIVAALGRDDVVERRAERKRERERERGQHPDARSRKKELDRTRNADPARKAAEAARQRARRQRLREGAEA